MNRGEIVELDNNYMEEMDSLNVDESDYFPTALAQECDEEIQSPTESDLGIAPVMPNDPAYSWSMPADGNIIEANDDEIDDANNAGISRLVGWAEHVAAEHEQAGADQDQFDYSSNDKDFIPAESSSESSSDMSSGG